MNNAFARKLTEANRRGYESGLWDGEKIMIDICSVALYNCFGFGKQSPEKWDKLGAEIQRIHDELMNPGEQDEVSAGFEHMVSALIRIFGEERREEFENKYHALLYSFGGERR